MIRTFNYDFNGLLEQSIVFENTLITALTCKPLSCDSRKHGHMMPVRHCAFNEHFARHRCFLGKLLELGFVAFAGYKLL